MSSFASPIVEEISRVRCTSTEYDVDFKAEKERERERERESFRDGLTIGEMSVKPVLRLVVAHLVKDPSKDKI